MSTLTFESSAVDSVLEPFGWSVDDDGWLVDERGTRLVATDRDFIKADEFAGVVAEHGRTDHRGRTLRVFANTSLGVHKTPIWRKAMSSTETTCRECGDEIEVRPWDFVPPEEREVCVDCWFGELSGEERKEIAERIDTS